MLGENFACDLAFRASISDVLFSDRLLDSCIILSALGPYSSFTHLETFCLISARKETILFDTNENVEKRTAKQSVEEKRP